ncbi:hypothetical protein LZD49_21340 [Dyadobacter sp. CY261]|uniref:hypothetical protein n=1 Tax=Dyadobacter sp. CY261 TaxID=2907203 RepID=UPI001F2CDBDA|nr:hypothetical protein [Dyadobacter sp. CY261]MCF0073039.1 hypothetical protein [Dyadobacter sp. CY261]
MKDLVINEPGVSPQIISQIAFHHKIYEITRHETMKESQRMWPPVFAPARKSSLRAKMLQRSTSYLTRGW